MINIVCFVFIDSGPINQPHHKDSSSDTDHEPSSNSGPRAGLSVANGSKHPTKNCYGTSLTKSNISRFVWTIEGGDDIDAGEVDEEQSEDGEPVIVSDTNKAILTIRGASRSVWWHFQIFH